MQKIILLSLNPTSYGILKSLKPGCFETICFTSLQSPYSKSRFIDTLIPIAKTKNWDSLCSTLWKISECESTAPFIIPSSDEEVLFLDRYRDILKNRFVLSLPGRTTTKKTTNKVFFHESIEKLSIKTPHTVSVNQGNIDALLLDDISYPVLMKPGWSNEWKTTEASHLLNGKKAIISGSAAELKRCVAKVSPFTSQLMLQEIIPHKHDQCFSYCCYADRHGRVLWGFVSQKLIQYPDHFGTAILCQTVGEPEISQFGRTVIEALGVDGISETEIIRDNRNGDLHIIEINPRHWLQHRLASQLGVNITLLDYYYRTGQQAPANKIMENRAEINGNAQSIWVDDLGYLSHSVKNRFNRRKCKFEAFRNKKTEFANLSARDILPFFKRLQTQLSLKF